MRPCAHCDEPIPPIRRSDALYCCSVCKRRADYRRNRDKRAAYASLYNLKNRQQRRAALREWRAKVKKARLSDRASRRCAFCSDVMPLHKRADARYCSALCRTRSKADRRNAQWRRWYHEKIHDELWVAGRNAMFRSIYRSAADARDAARGVTITHKLKKLR